MLFSALSYLVLFTTLFFEVFLLVTYLSKPARLRRNKPLTDYTPSVAIVVPCYNEQNTIGGTIKSILALDYPKDKLQIMLVDDGSKDNTAAVMDSYKDNPQITVIHKENGGKHTALNAGIEAARDVEYIGCLDADSFVPPDALRELIGYFDDPKIGAVTASMSVFEPKNPIEVMQNAEYVLGIAMRHIVASLNGLYVTPGPFSFYRRDLVLELGGFRKGHNTEDMEMALRIQRAGYIIDNAPRARAYTKVPSTVRTLVKQRTRWTTGFVRNVLYDYRDLVGNRNFGALGLLVLPLGLFAIVAGILLFAIIVFQTISQIVSTYDLIQGIPLTYSLLPRLQTLTWFYLPVTAIVLLGAVLTIGTIGLMVIGKRVSKTPGSLVAGIVAFIFLYGLVAPIWLIRTVFDVATGTRRSWR